MTDQGPYEAPPAFQHEMERRRQRYLKEQEMLERGGADNGKDELKALMTFVGRRRTHANFGADE